MLGVGITVVCPDDTDGVCVCVCVLHWKVVLTIIVFIANTEDR